MVTTKVRAFGRCPQCGNVRFARPEDWCHPCLIRAGLYSPVDPARAARAIEPGKAGEPAAGPAGPTSPDETEKQSGGTS